ncbi:MAG: twin-arginine translocase TatA/TatE family subunit [Vampirovibrionales bacterium]|jgi:sec-independent protein translocase protein TatA|nr:twin-arginine translocase TatA/TatE family subunit [Vampirovibrionales bacterium]
MFPTLGIGELLLVLALVLLLFGPGKLPQVAQSLGEAVNRFRNGTSKVTDVKASDPKISEAPSKASASDTISQIE